MCSSRKRRQHSSEVMQQHKISHLQCEWCWFMLLVRSRVHAILLQHPASGMSAMAAALFSLRCHSVP